MGWNSSVDMHGRSDVDTFMKDEQTLAHFQMFSDLVQNVVPADGEVKARTDALISGMIGIALCSNTIRGYPWTNASKMTEMLLAGIIQ
jgi:hypothetical protein